MSEKTSSSRHYVTVFVLAMMNVACVMSLRGLPMMATEGLSMIFFLLFASLFFLVPVSLVSAELATGWPQNGGVYRWVKEAFGSRWGFTAIWIQWIQNTIWYPTVLAFAAGAISYLFNSPGLDQNKIFNIVVILVVYWGATFMSFRGMKTAGWLSTAGVVGGTLLPAAIIIVLGILWVITGNPLEFMKTSHSIFPDLGNFSKIAFLAGIVLLFAGMEVGAVHVTELKNPKKDYPKAVFLAMFIIIIVFTLGSLAISAVIPAANISLTVGVMQAFSNLLDKFHIKWMMPIIGFLVAFGTIGGVTAWIAGPSKGLLATAKDGELPPFLQHTNKNGVQTHILFVQGAVVTSISLVYLLMPTVSSAFFLLTALTAILYLFMYGLLYAAAIRLRYSQPNVHRTYKVPGGNTGMCLIAGIGFLAVLFAFIVGFFPPAQLAVGSPTFYVVFLVVGLIVFAGAPLIINKLKKPEWMPKETNEQ
ncbi:MAG: amino acid permease [Candidatus Theseobacter exili]|nr:amino acid permease [Candidatus Theseobacter exili]